MLKFLEKYLNRYTKLLACILTAVLLTGANYIFPNLIWISFVPLILISRRLSLKKSFFIGWFTGAMVIAGVYKWVIDYSFTYIENNFLGSASLSLAIFFIHSYHWGIFLFLANYLRKTVHKIPFTLILTALFTTLEYVMPIPLPAFVYNMQSKNHLLLQIADITGTSGVTFITFFVNALFAAYIRAFIKNIKAPTLKLISGLIIIICVLSYGKFRIYQIGKIRENAPKIKIGLIQGNINPIEKNSPEYALKYLRLLQEASYEATKQGAELVVWPEGSYSLPIERPFTEDYPDDHYGKVMRGFSAHLIFGAYSYDPSTGENFNTSYYMNPDGKISSKYDKRKLILIGEHIPSMFDFPILTNSFKAIHRLTKGKELKPFPYKEHNIAPLICYEELYSEFSRTLIKLKPNILIGIGDSSWFPESSQQASQQIQHMLISIYRSIELRVDFARATNSGTSSFVDATGKVLKRSKVYTVANHPIHEPTVQIHEMALMPSEETIAVRWGNWFPNLCTIFILCILLFRVYIKLTNIIRIRFFKQTQRDKNNYE